MKNMMYKYYISSIAIISHIAVSIILFIFILQEYQNIFSLIGSSIILLTNNVLVYIYITCNIFITNSSEGEMR